MTLDPQHRAATLRAACRALGDERGRGGIKAMARRLGISARTLRHRLQTGRVSDECLLAVERVIELTGENPQGGL